MADGNPLLAVYYRDTQTIRVFELLNGSFVQIGTGNGFTVQEANSTSPSITPKVYWTNSGQRILFPRKTGRTGQVLSTSASVMGTTTISSGEYASVSSTDAKFANANEANTIFFVGLDGGSSSITQHKISDSGLSGVYRRHPLGLAVVDISASPDGKFVLCPRSNSNDVVLAARTGYASDGTANYEINSVNVGGPTSSAKWLRDSQAVIVVDSSKTLCTVYAPALVGPNGPYRLDKIQDLPSYGIVHRIQTSGDGRTIAIVYNNAGVYTTRIFRTYGKFVIEQKTLVFNNFGNSLDFTADGLHMIDAVSKMMYSFNGTNWVANNTAISVITSGGTAASVSPHIPNEINVSKLYNGAIGKFVDGYSGLDLRVHLLTDAASFNSAQTSIDTFPAGSIITNGDLPDYGIQITPSKSEQGVNYFISAPGVNHPVTTSFIQTRYAVVYDFNSKKPLIFYDFGSNRIIPVGTRLFISFRDDHLVTFGP